MSNFNGPDGGPGWAGGQQPQQPGWQQQQQPQQQPGWQQQQQPQQSGWQQQQQPQQPGWQQQQQPQQPGWQQQQPFGGQAVQGQAKKSPVGRVILAIAMSIVLGLGAFALYTALKSPDTGAASPEEAASGLMEALDNEDFLAIVENLPQGEREAMLQPSLNVLQELERLKVLESGTAEKGNDVSGIDISIQNVTPRVETVTDKIRWVTIDSGTASVSTNPAELPAGDLVKEDVASDPAETEQTDFANEPFNFAVIEEDGRWFVSFYYSIAEQARRDAGSPIPNPAAAPQPVGADSPEALAEQLVRQSSDLNTAGLVGLLDPEELRVVYDYASLFLPDAQQAANDVRAEAEEDSSSWTVNAVESKTEKRDGETVVVITRINATWIFEGESVDLEWDGKCVTVTGPDLNESGCTEELVAEFGPDDPRRGFAEIEYGFRAVERDGKWYIAGFPTFSGVSLDILKTLTPEQARELAGKGGSGVGGLIDQVQGVTI